MGTGDTKRGKQVIPREGKQVTQHGKGDLKDSFAFKQPCMDYGMVLST
jgi:hypothetical protein